MSERMKGKESSRAAALQNVMDILKERPKPDDATGGKAGSRAVRERPKSLALLLAEEETPDEE